MIRRSYIHEYAPHDQFMCESYYLLLESKDTLNELVKMENIIDEKTYFGESVESEILVLESEKKNIFTRIGEVIIQLFNSFIDLLKDTGKAIKDSITGIRKQSADDKFKSAMKGNPELAKDFLQAVMSGNIKAHDVKDLNSLIDEATKITNDLMNGKIDKKTFGEKVDEALNKFGNAAKNITSILGLVGAATGVIKGAEYLVHHKNDRKFQDEKQKHERNSWKNESVSDYSSSYYFTESTSFTEIIKKIMNFFTDHFDFCNNGIEKLNSIKERLLSKTKESKDSTEGENVNVAIQGIRKIMEAISKELTTVKNVAVKANTKFSYSE